MKKPLGLPPAGTHYLSPDDPGERPTNRRWIGLALALSLAGVSVCVAVVLRPAPTAVPQRAFEAPATPAAPTPAEPTPAEPAVALVPKHAPAPPKQVQESAPTPLIARPVKPRPRPSKTQRPSAKPRSAVGVLCVNQFPRDTMLRRACVAALTGG